MSFKPPGATKNDAAGRIQPAGLAFDACDLEATNLREGEWGGDYSPYTCFLRRAVNTDQDTAVMEGWKVPRAALTNIRPTLHNLTHTHTHTHTRTTHALGHREVLTVGFILPRPYKLFLIWSPRWRCRPDGVRLERKTRRCSHACVTVGSEHQDKVCSAK